MKRLLLIGIFLAITSSIFAKDEFTKSDAIDAICGNVGEYSQSVMRSRQLGENIANNIKVLNKTSKMSESTKQYYNAPKQMYRSVEQDRKPRDKPMHLWTSYL